MAKSGSNTTWSSNGGHYVKVVWNETGQSVENNRSTVRVQLYVGSKSGWSIYDSTNSYSLVIDGTTYSGSNANISQAGTEQLIMTQNVTINHNNDGTRSFSMRGSVSGLYFGGITGSSFSGALDRIARASTLSVNANITVDASKNITINRMSTSFSHELQIATTRSGVSNQWIRTETFSTSQTSRTVSFSAADLNKFYSNGSGYWTGVILTLITKNDSTEIGREVYTGSLTYPSVNSTAALSGNINLGNSVGVNINKASSIYSHEYQIRLPNGVSVASQGISAGSSFSSTPSSILVEQNSTTVREINMELWTRTVLSSNAGTLIQDWTRKDTKKITIPNSPPVMGTMNYTELVPLMSTITGTSGNNPTLVQGNSEPRFSFTASIPQRSASIVNYTVSLGGKSLSRNNAGSLDFTATALGGSKLNISSDTNATLTVTDSRGFTNSISVPVKYLSYRNPILTVTTKRQNGFGSTIFVNATVQISLMNGANNVNATSGFRWRYRVLPSGTFTSWGNRTSVLSNGVYRMQETSFEGDNTLSYEVEIEATDRLGNKATLTKRVSPGKPIFFIDSAKKAVGVNVFPNETAPSGEVASLEIGNDYGKIYTMIRQRVANNNEATLRFRQNDTNHGLEIFSRNDSYGFWSSGDNRTFLRYAVMAGNANTTAWDKGDVIIDPVGKLQVSANSEAIRIRGTDHNFISFFNGNTRQGWVGQGSAGTTTMTLSADVGNSELRSATGDVILNPQASGKNVRIISNGGLELNSNINLTSTTGTVFAHAFSARDSENAFVRSEGEVRALKRTSQTYIPVRASSFPTSSSIKYKEAIEEYAEDALQKIMETKVKTYSLKGHAKANRKVGVIIEEGVPDEIVEITGDAIDPYSMVSMSWKAIQQLGHELFVKDQEIEALHEKNQELEKRLERIEGLLGGGGR